MSYEEVKESYLQQKRANVISASHLSLWGEDTVRRISFLYAE